MRNQEVTKIFYEIAEFLDADKVSFKSYAYRRAAASLENLGEDIFNIYKKDGIKGLKEIDGIGESIAEHIEEYLKTGKIKIYEKYKDKLEIVTIAVDTDINDLKHFLGQNKYKWTFLHYGNKPDIVKDFDIRAYPTYFLVGPDKRLVISPAQSPNENFEQLFFKLLRSKGEI